MSDAAEAHRADMDRGADRLLLAKKRVVRRAAGPGCPCGQCKDLDEALAKHRAEELLAGIAAVTAEAELSLDGEARRCAKISSAIKRAEAVLEVIRERALKQQPGLIPAFRKAVDNYAGTHDADDGAGASDAEAPPVEDVIPWPHEVDGAEVLDAIVTVIQRHVNLPVAAAHAVALWAAFSHALDLCWFNPRLAICSPVKRCGKTTLVEVLAGLVARAKPSSGVTPAVVFRMIDLWKPTYLIDEADGYLPNNDELRSVLNSSHTRTGAWIDRNVKDPDGDWVPKSFSTWCPLVVAGIGRLPSTLDDRSIKVRLQRKPRGVQLTRFRADRVAGITALGRMLARFVLDNQIAIREADVEPPEKLHDRAADNWRPLMAIAAAAGGEWPARAAAAALALEQPDSDAEDLCVELLDDLRRIFILRPNTRLSERKRVYRAVAANDEEATHQVKLFTSEIMQALLAMQERPWLECNGGKALSQRGMATLLRSFSITTHKNVRRGAKTAKGFALDEFLAAFVSYLPPLFPHHRVTGSQPAETLGSGVTLHGSRSGTKRGTPDSEQTVTDGAADVPLFARNRDPARVTPEAAETLACDPVTLCPENEGGESNARPNNGLDLDAVLDAMAAGVPAGTHCGFCRAALGSAVTAQIGSRQYHADACAQEVHKRLAMPVPQAVPATPAKPKRKRSRIKGADTAPVVQKLPHPDESA